MPPRFAAPLALLLSLGLPRTAAAESAAFPSSDTFRQLQLQTLACARENAAAACDPARRQADPLIDHPRLPAACKDTLWAIVQQARPEASNSVERRDRLAQLAQDLSRICRQTVRPAQTPQPPSAGGGAAGGAGGFGFGSPTR